MTSYQPRLAIIGGGPAGLTLGRLLYSRGVHVTIYELRSKPSAEDLNKPCGVLDLHTESGLSAIRECGLWEDFVPLTGECGEQDKIYQYDGELLLEDAADESEEPKRPEISRHALINLLMSNIPQDMIKWNHKVTAVTSRAVESGNTEITLDFVDQDKETFDFVIGADGAWSKARTLLTSVKPDYAGIQFITLDIPSVGAKYPHMAKLLGEGTMMSLAFHNAILGQRGAGGAARIYLAISTPTEEFGVASGLGGMKAAEAKSLLLNDGGLFARWTAAFQEIIAVGCDEATATNPNDTLDIKPLYMLPVGHRWDAKTGVTLVGDAAHLMTPFAGEGVNLAMGDCQQLSAVIVKAVQAGNINAAEFQRTLEPLIKEFENTMLTRAGEKAEETWRNKGMMLDSDNGSAKLVELMAMYSSQADGH